MIIETKIDHLVNKVDFAKYQARVNEINEMINNRTGEGNDFLGWLDWPINYDKEELAKIKKDAEYIRANYDILVVCGIGGSYLGARAAIEAIKGTFRSNTPEIIYLGQSLDPTYIQESIEYLQDKKFAVNVISKSGTTTETSVSFRLLRELLEKRDGVEAARKAIFATTDKAKGALYTYQNKKDMRCLSAQMISVADIAFKRQLVFFPSLSLALIQKKS